MREQERYIRRTDEEFPEKLRQIKNPPEGIYVRGQLPAEDKPTVAIIGARRCSTYGREMAEWFAGELAAAGVQVVSGMAAGVDGIAQRASLRAGGRSFGVLGCGTDICYPTDNRDLYETLQKCGGILSEYAPGTPPDAFHFPMRNRIISGISDAVLVVEAKERSGTLITVDFALEQGREVFVLPGRITDNLSAGCNRLLRQGAGIALSPKDIMEEMGRQNKWKVMGTQATQGTAEAAEAVWTVREKRAAGVAWTGKGKQAAGAVRTGKGIGKTQVAGVAGETPPPEGLSERERQVWEILDTRPQSAQELYERLHADLAGEAPEMAELTDLLMNLVLKGLAGAERGCTYVRKTQLTSTSAYP